MKQSLSRDCIFKGCVVLGDDVENLLDLWATLFHAQKTFTQRLADISNQILFPILVSVYYTTFLYVMK